MFLFFLIVVFSALVSADENILCSPSICDKVTCDHLPKKCTIQNSTHSGTFLPSPTICNCCQYCLENLLEGDMCSTGNPASPTATSICGPGLYCKALNAANYNGICTRQHTECTMKQDEYDNSRAVGTLGTMEDRQACDEHGQYAPYKCIPGQTCYCLDKNGNRIFGESDFTSIPEANMKCQCSRDYVQAVELVGRELNPSEHFRCSSNGDYDTLQCLGQRCLCVDAFDGAPTYPNDPIVNITKLSTETLPCYNKIVNAKYHKKCEAEYLAVLEEIELYKKDGYTEILSFVFPKCDIDGTYEAVQENATHKMCVDKEGTVLAAIDIAKEYEFAMAMNCKCLRAVSIMSTNEKPKCSRNGNYEQIQCRRGICRCVDENGNQICKTKNCEVEDIEPITLTC